MFNHYVFKFGGNDNEIILQEENDKGITVIDFVLTFKNNWCFEESIFLIDFQIEKSVEGAV